MNAPALTLHLITADEAWSERLRARLAAEGAEVRVRGGTDEGSLREALREGELDAVILDGGTPGANAAEIAALLANVRSAPVLVFAAPSHGPEMLEALRAGARDAFVRDGGEPLLPVLSLAIERWRARGRAREAAANYRMLVEEALVGIYLFQDGRLLYANPRLAEIFGYTIDELLSLPDINPIIFPGDRGRVAETVRRRATGSPRSLRYRLRGVRRDGAHIEFESHGFATRVGGRPAIIGSIVDITERVRAEQAVLRRDAMLQATIEASSDAKLILDADGGVLARNRQFARLWGLHDAELAGLRAPALQSLLAGLVERGVPLPDGGAPAEVLELKDGRLLERVAQPFAAPDGGSGRVIRFRDMTAQRALVAQARLGSDRLHAMVRQLGDIITLLDRDMTILYESPAVERITGHPPEALVGRPAAEYVHPEDAPAVAEAYRQIMSRPGGSGGITFRFRRRDGEWVWLEAVGTNHLDDPSVGAIIVVSRDITERMTFERARGELDERLRALIAHSADIITLLDGEGRIIAGNPGLGIPARLGYSHEALMGRPIFSLIHPEDRDRVRSEFAALAREPGLARTIELRFARADGRWVWLEAVATNQLANPAIGAIVINSRDVTERKAMEAALREGETRFRLLVENLQQGVVLIQDGRFIYANPAFATITGHSRNELLALESVTAIIVPEDRPLVAENIRKRMSGEIASVHYTAGGLRKDGRRIELEILGSRVEHLGRPAILSTVIDITERAEMERALRESEERFQRFMDNSPLLAFIKDENGRYTWVNRRFGDFFGRPAAEWIGRTDAELLPGGEAAQFRANDLAVLAEGRPVEIHETAIDAAGRERTSLVVKFPLSDGRGGRFVAGMALDVTERTAAEESLRRLNAELTATSQELNTILETLPGMIFLKDAKDLRFVRFNRAGEELLGIPRTEMLGRNDHDFFSREQADFFIAKDREVLASGRLLEIPEEPIQTRSRGQRWLHTRKIPIPGPDGAPRYLLGVSEDITEFKRVESALRESEARFKAIVQNAQDTVLLLDEQGKVLYASPSLDRLLGWPAGEAGGRAFREFFAAEDQGTARELLARTLAAPGATLPADLRMERRDGKARQIEAVLTNRLADPAIRAVIVNARDVTERRMAEEWLARTLQRLRLHFERTPLAVIEWSHDRRVQAWNPAAQRIFGWNAIDAEGREIDFLCPEGGRSEAREMLERLFSAPGTREAPVLRLVTADRRLIHTQWFNTPLMGDDGRVFAVASLVEDVSELVRTRRELEEFIFTTAHDLKAPLLSVKAFAELALRRTGLQGPAADPLGRVIANAARMERLVSGVLEYARIGHRERRESWINYEDTVRALMGTYIPPGDPVTIVHERPPVDRLQLLIDPRDLERILANFTANSRNYRHPDRALRLTIGLASGTGPETGMLGLQFADNGTGVPPEQHEYIFRLFARLQQGEGGAEGHGVGLAIVKRLVEDYGGRVAVESLPEGVRFTIWLPGSRFRGADGGSATRPAR